MHSDTEGTLVEAAERVDLPDGSRIDQEPKNMKVLPQPGVPTISRMRQGDLLELFGFNYWADRQLLKVAASLTPSEWTAASVS